MLFVSHKLVQLIYCFLYFYLNYNFTTIILHCIKYNVIKNLNILKTENFFI